MCHHDTMQSTFKHNDSDTTFLHWGSNTTQMHAYIERENRQTKTPWMSAPRDNVTFHFTVNARKDKRISCHHQLVLTHHPSFPCNFLSSLLSPPACLPLWDWPWKMSSCLLRAVRTMMITAFMMRCPHLQSRVVRYWFWMWFHFLLSSQP